jgi:hypothetical protein
MIDLRQAELPGDGDGHVAAQRSRLGEADSVEERSGAKRREHRRALTARTTW